MADYFKDRNDIFEGARIYDDMNIRTRYQDNYVLKQFLGEGSFANVYLGTYQSTNDDFAIKIIDESKMRIPQYHENILNEVAIHKTLNHENIVKFYTSFEWHGHYCMVLELCSNRSLISATKRTTVFPVQEIRFYMTQLLNALQYLHSQGIVHRDIKLSNLLLTECNTVKVCDFGLAVKENYPGETFKKVCGTPAYMAPEIFSQRGYNFSVDIWAAGVILYMLFEGKTPFTIHHNNIYRNIRIGEIRNPKHVDKEAFQMIQLMLQQSPLVRPTAEQLLSHVFLQKTT